jgi:glutathione reductase (NADPH)
MHEAWVGVRLPKSAAVAFSCGGLEASLWRLRLHRAENVAPFDSERAATLEGRFIVIAAGMVPADLKIPGTGHLTTSDQFLELDELPRKIVFIGGGYIAFEFAHVAARAGSQVTVLHRGPRPLALFDHRE